MLLFICIRKQKEKKLIKDYLKHHTVVPAGSVHKGLEDFGDRLDAEASMGEESAFIISDATEFGVIDSPIGSERKTMSPDDVGEMETLLN